MALPEQSAETLTDLLGAAYDEQIEPDKSLVENDEEITENVETSEIDEDSPDELELDDTEEDESDEEVSEEDAETEEEPETEEVLEAIEPPGYMNATQKETFAGLPVEAQQILKDRYGEQELQYTQKGQKQAP